MSVGPGGLEMFRAPLAYNRARPPRTLPRNGDKKVGVEGFEPTIGTQVRPFHPSSHSSSSRRRCSSISFSIACGSSIGKPWRTPTLLELMRHSLTRRSKLARRSLIRRFSSCFTEWPKGIRGRQLEADQIKEPRPVHDRGSLYATRQKG